MDEDELYYPAKEIILKTHNTSISHLQRKLMISYNRARATIEQLKSDGIVLFFADILEIIKFTINQIKNNRINENSCIKIYDIYRQLYKIHTQIALVISYISRDIDNSNPTTSFDTPTKKWLYFNNKELEKYDNLKHELFCKLSVLDNGHERDGILARNFISKSLNCKVDEHFGIINIDDELKLTNYKFIFKDEDNEAKAFRNFDELFLKESLDISDETKKQNFIEAMKVSYSKLKESIEEFENIILEKCETKDLLFNIKE